MQDHLNKRDRDRRHDAKRREEKPWRAWYNTPRWQAIREAQLTAEPLCERCKREGTVRKATVVHHKDRHEGDPVKFWNGPFASSCASCHNSIEQSIERLGYEKGCGVDGWPIDPKHAVNKKHG